MSEKTYINGIFIKEVQGQYGPFFNMTITDAFIKQYEELKKEGKLRITISKRREEGKYGDTHYAVLDTWQPQEQSGNYTAPETKDTAPETNDNDLPF